MTNNGSAYRSHHFATPATRSRCVTFAPGRTRRGPTARPSASSRPVCASWAYARPFASSPERTAALSPWLDHYNTARPHAALAHQPPATRLHPSAFLGSTDGAVPPSRPAITDDRSAGSAPGVPQATGASRRGEPCGGPPHRSRSNWRAPNAQAPEQRSWKRQLGLRRAARTKSCRLSRMAAGEPPP